MEEAAEQASKPEESTLIPSPVINTQYSILKLIFDKLPIRDLIAAGEACKLWSEVSTIVRQKRRNDIKCRYYQPYEDNSQISSLDKYIVEYLLEKSRRENEGFVHIFHDYLKESESGGSMLTNPIIKNLVPPIKSIFLGEMPNKSENSEFAAKLYARVVKEQAEDFYESQLTIFFGTWEMAQLFSCAESYIESKKRDESGEELEGDEGGALQRRKGIPQIVASFAYGIIAPYSSLKSLPSPAETSTDGQLPSNSSANSSKDPKDSKKTIGNGKIMFEIEERTFPQIISLTIPRFYLPPRNSSAPSTSTNNNVLRAIGLKIKVFKLDWGDIEKYKSVKNNFEFETSCEILNISPEDSVKGILIFDAGSSQLSVIIQKAIFRYLKERPNTAMAGGIMDKTIIATPSTESLNLEKNCEVSGLVFCKEDSGNTLDFRVSSSGFFKPQLHHENISNLTKLKKSLKLQDPEEQKRRKSFAFQFSCYGRGTRMFDGQQSVESNIFMEHFPETKLIGIFTGGEYCHKFYEPLTDEPDDVNNLKPIPPRKRRDLLFGYTSAFFVVSYLSPY